jgi:hypothetical protein
MVPDWSTDSPSFAHVPDLPRGCIREVQGVVKPETGLKSSLRVTANADGPHMFGRESGLLRFDWMDLLLVSRQFGS